MEATNEKRVSDHVLKTPVWMMVIRGFAMLISLIIFGLCARLMHDAYLDEEGFSLAVALLTWLATLYIILTEKITGLQKFYNVIAVLVLDGLFMILWLAAFAATAARRAKYRYAVSVGNCQDDGSLFDSKSCDLMKRGVILFKTGLAMFAAIAGLGAIVWLLFIASFVWTLLAYLRGRKEGRFTMNAGTSSSTPSNNYQMENKIAESQPMNSPQGGYPPQQQFQQNPGTEYVSPVQQNYPQGQFQQPHPTQSPYQNQTAYPPPQQQQQQFQGQQNFQQYPPQQQPYQQPTQPQMTGQQQQQPIQPQMTGQSQPYGSELSGSDMYQSPPHPAVSPPPQQYHTPPPQQYQAPPPQQPQQYQQYQQQ